MERGDRARTERLDSQAELVHNVAFSPDGKTLLATANDGDIRVWDLDELNIDRIEESTPSRRSLSGDTSRHGLTMMHCRPTHIVRCQPAGRFGNEMST